jgi:hypothetical protein
LPLDAVFSLGCHELIIDNVPVVGVYDDYSHVILGPWITRNADVPPVSIDAGIRFAQPAFPSSDFPKRNAFSVRA